MFFIKKGPENLVMSECGSNSFLILRVANELFYKAPFFENNVVLNVYGIQFNYLVYITSSINYLRNIFLSVHVG